MAVKRTSVRTWKVGTGKSFHRTVGTAKGGSDPS